ncbi:uncharacterized protein [Amphiura filiformis]|uniref:uncharacterized protein n=1 Tax=Amphiura filiformis TaxID=82378 RepID=UPI003B217A66
MEDCKGLISAASDKWCRMVRDRNAAGLASLYTEDCQLYVPGLEPVIGRAAFEKFAEGFIASGIKNATIVTNELDESANNVAVGGTFWEKGSYTFYKEDGTVMEAGRHVIIWKLVSPGNLQYFIDISNKV